MSELQTKENKSKILGIRIDNVSRSEIKGWIEEALAGLPRQKFIATLNPEIILKGYYDKDYASILNSTDLSLCDGFGVKFATWLKGRKIKARYTGVDLVDYSLRKAKEENLNVLIIASKDSLSDLKEIKQGIERKYGIISQAKYRDNEIFFESGAAKEAEIVFVNFGAPHQEKFIFENRAKFPKAKILAGVGGTFDFLTGKMKRAPKWMQKAGLEWIFRLIQEPKRVKRIWNAVFVFPILAILRSK